MSFKARFPDTLISRALSIENMLWSDEELEEIKMGTKRRKLDSYYTPPFMTNALMINVPEIKGRIFEPCAGDGGIVDTLRTYARMDSVYTNDIDPLLLADFHFDASYVIEWAPLPEIDWVVTNPPYDHRVLLPIVKNALMFARKGAAMLLRLSFEEPTKSGPNARGPFFDQPDNLIQKRLVLPRYSFTGDGKSDSVTVAWMIWAKEQLEGPANVSLYKAEERYR